MFVTTLAGIQMPKIIYGTAWKKDKTKDLVIEAVRSGFMGIDTACQPKHYHEPGVGAALKVLAEQYGIPRDKLFIQTKFTSVNGQDPKSIPYEKTSPLKMQVTQSLEVSLKNLGTTYIDSLVLHGPMSTYKQTLEVWATFESFVDSGQVKQLGMSNCYNLEMFKSLYRDSRIKPSVLQNRFYSETGFDKELRNFCREKGIFYQSFWTLTANPNVLKDPKVTNMASVYKKTPAQLLFAYLIQTGVVTPLTGTTNVEHMKQDLEAVTIKLSDEDMAIFDEFFD